MEGDWIEYFRLDFRVHYQLVLLLVPSRQGIDHRDLLLEVREV